MVSRALLLEAIAAVRQTSAIKPALTFEAAQMAGAIARAPRVEARTGSGMETEARAAAEAAMAQVRIAVASGRLPAHVLDALDEIEARGERLAEAAACLATRMV